MICPKYFNKQNGRKNWETHFQTVGCHTKRDLPLRPGDFNVPCGTYSVLL